MTLQLPLETMSVAAKLDALEAIWASLCSKPADLASPVWHEQVLAERKRRLESGEATISAWSDAKNRLRELGK